MAIFIPLVTKFDNKGLNNARNALSKFGSFAADIGKVATAAIAGVGVAAVREASQFETSFSRIQGLVGVTVDEIEELEEAAKRLGPEFGVSANEAAEALFFITSAGLRGAGATEVLEASLKGAAVGLGDTKTIADLATSAVNAYGESTLGGAEAVDVLAEAVRLGKLAPEELAGSMGMVLPLASNLGVSFAEVGGALAGMSKTGTDASTASTQLRQILATIAKPTSEANDALADMGLSAEGLREQIKEKGLFSTLETLTDAFDGNIEATSSVFGNVRALSGVLDLMGESVDDNRELFNKMTDDTGVLDEALAITAETSEFKFNSAMAGVKENLLEIGQAILEDVSPRLDDFSAWMEENGEPIEQGFIKVFDAIDKIVGAIGQLLTEDVLPAVKDIFEDEKFKRGVASIAAGITVIAVEAKRFVDSDLGGFLADLTKDALLESLSQLGENLENIGIFLGIINDTLNLLQGKGGTTTFDELMQLGLSLRGATFGGALAENIFSAIIGEGMQGSGSDAGRRAGGGPVASGSSYLVGELGPELFTPAAGGGSITPNNQLGGATYNITVNAGMGSGNGSQIGEAIVTAIKRYERTSGPVFARA